MLSQPSLPVKSQTRNGFTWGFKWVVPRLIRHLLTSGNKELVNLIQRWTCILCHLPQAPAWLDVSRPVSCSCTTSDRQGQWGSDLLVCCMIRRFSSVRNLYLIIGDWLKHIPIYHVTGMHFLHYSTIEPSWLVGGLLQLHSGNRRGFIT